MVQKRKSTKVKCTHFSWQLYTRNGVYQADGRGNEPPLGRHTLTTRKYEKALEELKALDTTIAVRMGLAPAPAPPSDAKILPLDDGKDEYLAFVARPRALKGGSTSTQKRYRGICEKALPFLERRGIRTWNEVTEDVLQQYGSFLDEKGYAHATQVVEVVTLKQAINYFIARGLLPPENNFTLGIDKVTESTTYCFTAEEVDAMVRHCRVSGHLDWLADVLVGLAYTGMRIGELCQLRWTAVHARMVEVVDDSRRGAGNGRGERTTKSGRSRLIPIHGRLRSVLDRLRGEGGCGLVFRAQRAGPLRPRNVLQAFIEEVIEPLKGRFPGEPGEVGFASGRLHSFRHFFCSLCANEGVSERVLMQWLGHTSSAMVKRYYHLQEEESQLQMAKLEKRDFLGDP
jgi:integrase